MRTFRCLSVAVGFAACHTPSHYLPRVRAFTVTTVPLLTTELARTYPFLTHDFARGGVLDGKEVYGFVPSTLVVYVGDTLDLTFFNPEDDAHTFVLPDFAIALPGQTTRTARYVAHEAGIFTFRCNIPRHAPMMSGELVVLPADRGS
ncbi:MAG TPA: cupredoxin domain-containing protein [Gemmatimonadales bacterium]|nr:cupredoxin domain-containing protein [Gemmatimonadales bacterium]